jgi:hypothetical protein
MTEQLDLFADIEADERRDETIRSNWRGRVPAIGDYVNTVGICGTLEDGTSIYCYMERIRLVELRADGKWVGVIDMGLVHGQPWGKDGTRIVMGLEDMRPDYRRVRHDA